MRDVAEIEEEIAQYRNYLTQKEPSMRITKKALTTVATWADMHNKPIMLGDIPWQLKRYNLLQKNHLMNLTEMCHEAMLKSHVEDVTLHEATLRTYPDFLLHNSDEYMATIL